MKLTKAAELVENHIGETMSYYAFPSQHRGLRKYMNMELLRQLQDLAASAA